MHRGNRKMQPSRIDETKREFHRAPDTVHSWSIGLTDSETELRGRGVQNAWNNTGPAKPPPGFGPERYARRSSLSAGCRLVFGMSGMCDGDAMGDKCMRHSLTSRESMTDTIELIVELHRFCGMVLPGRCDEKMPGMWMEAARCNIPAIAVTGEANIPGSQECRDFLSIVLFDDMGTRAPGSMREKDLVAPECAAGVI